jgi:hypothetical protein
MTTLLDPVVSILDEAEVEYDFRLPSATEQEVVRATFTKFRASADDRDKAFEYFDNQTLIEFINDSVRRFVTNVDIRENIEDWQAIVHNPFTRNKVLTILAKVMRVLPIAEFTARGDEDCRKASILNDLYQYTEELDDYEELMTFFLLEAIVKGTAIGYEGYSSKDKKIRIVKGVNDEITITEQTVKRNKLFGAVVPLEEFYPSSVSIRTIKEMPYCFWSRQMPYSKFMMDWGGFGRAKVVQPKMSYGKDELRPYYADYISTNVLEGNVEVIRYYNKDNDEYIVIANGIWLNPVMTGKEKNIENISPLPFNHKELPFYDVKFDFYGADFFYGKSLPDRLKSLQDVLNVLNNMMLDQSFLSVFSPILTSGIDPIEDDYLRPGRRIPIDTQGQALNQAVMKMDVGTPSGWHQYILEYTKRIMEESSVDGVSSGNAGVGGRTTAQEIRVAADGVASMLGLFGRTINIGAKRKAYLRAANILQFGTDPKSPLLEGVLGEGGREDFAKAFGVYNINNTVLTNGKRGTRIITMYSDTSEMPTRGQLKAKSLVASKTAGKEVEYTAISGEYLRNFLFDTKMVMNQKSEATKEIEKAMAMEKTRVYMAFFPEGVDKPELAAQLAEKMGDDPTKIFKADWLTPPPPDQQAETPPGQPNQNMNTQPQDNTSQNMLRGAEGGEEGLNDMAQMSMSMLG